MRFFHKKQAGENEPVVAATVFNPVDSGIFEDLLRKNGIPYLIRQHGAGGYFKILAGGGVVPDCFYVRPEHLAQAKALYRAYFETETDELTEED